MKLILLGGLLLVPVAAACTASVDDGCAYPVGQQASQPCCTKHGRDACGANLVCAVMDGRTQPTCYGERSRTVGQSCTVDEVCFSQACRSGRCLGGETERCVRDNDCAIGRCLNKGGVTFGCGGDDEPRSCQDDDDCPGSSCNTTAHRCRSL
jgi:hypothetical protein